MLPLQYWQRNTIRSEDIPSVHWLLEKEPIMSMHHKCQCAFLFQWPNPLSNLSPMSSLNPLSTKPTHASIRYQFHGSFQLLLSPNKGIKQKRACGSICKHLQLAIICTKASFSYSTFSMNDKFDKPSVAPDWTIYPSCFPNAILPFFSTLASISFKLSVVERASSITITKETKALPQFGQHASTGSLKLASAWISCCCFLESAHQTKNPQTKCTTTTLQKSRGR